MANETILNIPATIAAVNAYTINTTTVTGNITLNAAGTTLGDAYGSEVPKVVFTLGRVGPLSAASLSATSVVFTFSAASPAVSTSYTGTVVESKFASNSAIFTLAFPQSTDLLTTKLYLSGNGTSIVIDPTRTSKLDNFFYVNGAGVVKTTAGHSRLVQYLG